MDGHALLEMIKSLIADEKKKKLEPDITCDGYVHTVENILREATNERFVKCNKKKYIYDKN